MEFAIQTFNFFNSRFSHNNSRILFFSIKAQRKQTIQLHIKYLLDSSLDLMPMDDT